MAMKTVGFLGAFAFAQRLPRRCAEFSRLWLLALTVAVILGPVARPRKNMEEIYGEIWRMKRTPGGVEDGSS